MFLEDAIAQSVSQYPCLYATDSVELSRLLVLNQFFLVNGNGMKWAKTRKASDGGYLTYPNYKKVKGFWKRKIDPPYGTEVYKGEPIERFTKEPYVSISLPSKHVSFMVSGDLDKIQWEGFITEIPDIYKDKLIFQFYTKKFNNEDLTVFNKFGVNFNYDNYTYVISIEKSSSTSFKPYPMYTKGWPFAHIVTQDIREDWRYGMIEVFQKALEYEENACVENDSGYIDNKSWATTLLKYKDNIPLFIKDYGFNGFPYDKITEENLEEAVSVFMNMQFRKYTDERIVALKYALVQLKDIN